MFRRPFAFHRPTGIERYLATCPTDCPCCFSERIERAVERAIDTANLLRPPARRGINPSTMLIIDEPPTEMARW